MKEALVVKHAVGGRTFIDTGKHPLAYTVASGDDGWTFTVNVSMNENIRELLKWSDELNVFLFREFAAEPTRKIWFYVKEGSVVYDAEREQLTIRAKSRIEYVPDQFGMT